MMKRVLALYEREVKHGSYDMSAALKEAVPMGHMVLMEDLVGFLKGHHVQDSGIILGVLMIVVANIVVSFYDDPLVCCP